MKIDCLFLSMMLDLDPCIEVTCGHYGYCKAMGPHDARCICVDRCPSYQEPVCSSNGTTYDNKCLFEQEMCSLQLNFTIQHPGSCEGKINLIYIYFSLILCGWHNHMVIYITLRNNRTQAAASYFSSYKLH